jgi:hypothetical protein
VRAFCQEHLEPEDGILSELDPIIEYNLTIRKCLLRQTDTTEMARLLCLPSLSPEWVVTVRRNDESQVWEVEVAVAEKRLWDCKDPEKVPITRRLAPIDSTSAERIRKAWSAMLEGVRYPRDVGIRGLVQDGMVYHFSMFVDQVGVRAGRWSDQDGDNGADSPPARLARVAEAVRKYAEGPPQSRGENKALILRRIMELERSQHTVDRPRGGVSSKPP